MLGWTVKWAPLRRRDRLLLAAASTLLAKANERCARVATIAMAAITLCLVVACSGARPRDVNTVARDLEQCLRDNGGREVAAAVWGNIPAHPRWPTILFDLSPVHDAHGPESVVLLVVTWQTPASATAARNWIDRHAAWGMGAHVRSRIAYSWIEAPQRDANRRLLRCL